MDKKIAVDLDDVVLDFVGGLRAALKQEYNVELDEDSITDFNLAPFLDPSFVTQLAISAAGDRFNARGPCAILSRFVVECYSQFTIEPVVQ